MPVTVKRVYEDPARADGYRVLVDRLWPRGLTKDAAHVDLWLKEIAPSNELRRWYHARPLQWPAFREKYRAELSQGDAFQAFQELQALATTNKRVTLLYSSKDTERNNATVLKELLDGTRKPPRSTGAAGAAVRVAKRAQMK